MGFNLTYRSEIALTGSPYEVTTRNNVVFINAGSSSTDKGIKAYKYSGGILSSFGTVDTDSTYHYSKVICNPSYVFGVTDDGSGNAIIRWFTFNYTLGTFNYVRTTAAYVVGEGIYCIACDYEYLRVHGAAGSNTYHCAYDMNGSLVNVDTDLVTGTLYNGNQIDAKYDCLVGTDYTWVLRFTGAVFIKISEVGVSGDQSCYNYSYQLYYVASGSAIRIYYDNSGTLTLVTTYTGGSNTKKVYNAGTNVLITDTGDPSIKVIKSDGTSVYDINSVTKGSSEYFGFGAYDNTTNVFYVESIRGGTCYLSAFDGLEYYSVVDDTDNASKYVGETATFTAGLTGANLIYQWYKNAIAIPGATGTSYTTPTLYITDDSNGYYLIGTESGTTFTLTTNYAFLDVTSVLSIPLNPDNAIGLVGYPSVFEVGATGYNLEYQWYKVEFDTGVTGILSGEITTTYTIPYVSTSDNGDGFFAKVTEENNPTSVYSDLATLTVADLSGLTGPNDQYYFNGNSVTFGITGLNTSGLTLQWQKEV